MWFIGHASRSALAAGAALLLVSGIGGSAPAAGLSSPATDHGWSEPVTLDSQSGDLYWGSPTVAINNDGRAVAMWMKEDASTGSHPHVATTDAAGAWSAPTTLGDGRTSPYPAVAIGPGGHAAVLWLTWQNRLMVSVQAPGGAWTAPVEVDGPIPAQDRSSTMSQRSMVVLSSGHTRIAWRSGEQVKVATVSAEGEPSEPVVISTRAATKAPLLASTGNGSTTLWWTQQRSDSKKGRLVAKRWLEDDSWSDRVLVARSILGHTQVLVATDRRRAAVALNDISGRLVVRETRRGRAYRTTWERKAPPKDTSHYLGALTVTGGRVMLAWSMYYDLDYSARRKIVVRNRAGKWGKPHSAFVSFGHGHSYRLQAAMTRRGKVVVAWGVADAAEPVQVQERSARGKWRRPYLMASDASSPSLAMNRAGDAVLAWTEEEPETGDVRYQVTSRPR